MDQDERVTRRQEAPTTYVPNGAVYVAGAAWMREPETFYTEDTVGHPMPHKRSADVDTSIDLAWCSFLQTSSQVSLR